MQKLAAYCAQDVVVERAVRRAVPPLIASEQELWQIDFAINARGFNTDIESLEPAARVAAEANRRVQEDIVTVTDGAINSIEQKGLIKDWLAEHACIVENIRKPTLHHALRRKGLRPEAKRVIELRLAGAQGS